MNIAKVQYRGHGIHRNTLVGFQVLIFRVRDKKIKQRSMMEAKHRDQTKFMVSDNQTAEWRMNPHHSSILGLNCMCLG
jgi:hypothetical protein